MLTRRNKLFIQEYIRTQNASEAVRRVYPAIKKPNVYGAVLLAKDSIKAEIEAYFKSLDMTKEDIQRAIANIGKSGKVEANRLRALELLARIHKLMQDAPPQQVAIFQNIEKELAHLKDEFIDERNKVDVKDDVRNDAIIHKDIEDKGIEP